MRTVMHMLTATVLSAGLLLSAAGADAQQVCLPREQIVAQLGHDYDETAIGRGVVRGAESMVELFASKGGSWTIVVTTTTGTSCLVASGQSWSALPRLVRSQSM